MLPRVIKDQALALCPLAPLFTHTHLVRVRVRVKVRVGVGVGVGVRVRVRVRATLCPHAPARRRARSHRGGR